MNCVELQDSLAEVENGSTLEQREHLQGCTACSTLVQELDMIVAAAGQLQGVDEPSPRVWNSIEIALRQEGLIRPQRSGAVAAPSFGARWGSWRWLAPAAAMLLLAIGIYMHRESQPIATSQQASVNSPIGMSQSGLNDDDLMQEVSDGTPALKTQYADNLRRVNESIREAQGVVDESPNDSDARRSLMDAYQQKSMLFEMAMDRSMP
jgi:hypothetical protein